ncbi:MAG: Hsp20/alpha crystallin family protein [Bacteroidetes bacterium]|nr:MAG: Hsp20/alpha crystallin family protein [Bacteroidota bacterium]
MNNITKYHAFPTTKFFSNSLFDDFFNRSIADFVGSDGLINQPAVNILETDTAFKLELAAPGLDKQDFNLNVEDNYLTISASQKTEEKKEGEEYTRREFRYEAFERSFKLPETVNQDAITAVYENGVLQVTLSKVEEARPVVKKITVG